MDETILQSALRARGIGVDPIAAPFGADMSPEGVSVDYILSDDFRPLPEHLWFVLRADYGRELLAVEALRDRFFAYVPTHTVLKVDQQGKHLTRASYMPNVLFAYTTRHMIDELKQPQLGTLPLPHRRPIHITPRYDHTSQDAFGHDRYMTIPHREMLNFMRLIRVDDEHTRLYMAEKLSPHVGDYVRVTQGPLTGVEGYLARIQHQKCLLVVLPNLLCAKTSYVPPYAIEKILPPSIDQSK